MKKRIVCFLLSLLLFVMMLPGDCLVVRAQEGKYTITLKEPEESSGSKIEADKLEAAPGEKVTLTIEVPSIPMTQGIERLDIMTTSGASITKTCTEAIDENGTTDFKCEFTMPSENVSVDVTFTRGYTLKMGGYSQAAEGDVVRLQLERNGLLRDSNNEKAISPNEFKATCLAPGTYTYRYFSTDGTEIKTGNVEVKDDLSTIGEAQEYGFQMVEFLTKSDYLDADKYKDQFVQCNYQYGMKVPELKDESGIVIQPFKLTKISAGAEPKQGYEKAYYFLGPTDKNHPLVYSCSIEPVDKRLIFYDKFTVRKGVSNPTGHDFKIDIVPGYIKETKELYLGPYTPVAKVSVNLMSAGTVKTSPLSEDKVTGTAQYELSVEEVKDGYVFQGWVDAEEPGKILSEELKYTVTLDKDTEYIAMFKKRDTAPVATAAPSPAAGGSVQKPEMVGEYDQKTGKAKWKLSAAANDGYVFQGWARAIDPKNILYRENPCTVELTSDTAYVAVFGEGEELAAFRQGSPAAGVSALDYDSVKVSWKPYKNAASYIVSRRAADEKDWKDLTTVQAGANAKDFSYTDNGVRTGVTYYYTVRAVAGKWGGGVESKRLENLSVKTALGKAALKSVKSASYKSGKLTWKKVAGASGYQIKRAASRTGSYKTVKTVKKGGTLSCTDSSLTTGKTYYYKIRAYRTVGKETSYGAYSAVKSVKIALPAPKIAKVSAAKRALTVKWSKVSGASGYKVYRATAKNGKYTAVKTVGKSKVSLKQTKLKKGKKYYYKVRAYRTVGGKKVWSAYSAVKSGKAK